MATTRTAVVYDLIGRDHASRTFRQVGDSGARLERTIGKVGRGIATAGAAMGVAAVAGVKKSFDAFAQFDKTIRQVGAVTDQSGAKLKAMSDLALKMGKDTTFSAGEAAQAMLELAKGGMTAAQIRAGGLRHTLTLAAAGGINLADAAAVMTNELNAFGLGAKDAAKVAAALAGGANASTASVDSLRMALSQVGAGARNAGLSLNETVGVLAAFDSAGIKGSDAGTSLKVMLQRLVPSTAKARDAMKELGLKFADSRGEFLSITEIAEQLHDKLGNLSAAQKAQALQTIFGSDATRAATILMRDGAKGIEKYIKATFDRSAAEKLAKTNTSGAAGAVEQLRGSLETLAIKVGQALAPAITSVIGGMTGLVDMVGDSIPAIEHFGSVLVNRLIPVDALKKQMGSAKEAIGDFFAGLTGKPTGDTTIQRMLTAGAEVPKSAARQMGEQIRSAISGGFANIDTKKLGATLGHALGSAFQFVASNAGPLANQIITAIAGLDWVNIGKQVGGKALGFGIGFLAALGDDLFSVEFWKKHWWDVIQASLFAAGVGKVAGILAKVFGKVPVLGPLLRFADRITKPLQKILIEAPIKILRFMGRSFLEGFRRVFPGVGKAFGQWLRLLPTQIGVGAIRVAEAAGRMVRGFGRAIARGAGFVVGKVGELIGRTLKPFARAGGWLVRRGRQLVGGLMGGVVDAMKGIGGWVKSHIVDPIVGAVKRFFGIKSPSTVFAGIGFNMVRGLIRGLAKTNGRAIVSRIFGDMPGALGALLSKGLVSVSQLPGKAIRALGGLGRSIGGVALRGNAAKNMALGRAMAAARGWTGGQWAALRELWTRESGWNNFARNPSSGAYGIPQALPPSKMGRLANPPLSSALAQIRWGLGYIAGRYGSPAAALAWHNRHNWYDAGGLARGSGFLPKATPRPERILSPRQTEAFERLVASMEGRNTGELRIASGELRIVEDRNGGLRGIMRHVVVEEMADERAFRGRR